MIATSAPYTPPVPEDSAPDTPDPAAPEQWSQVTPAASFHWDDASQVTNPSTDTAMPDVERVDYEQSSH
eukprot:2067663-Heterocapsa_arctica.AAC.1